MVVAWWYGGAQTGNDLSSAGEAWVEREETAVRGSPACLLILPHAVIAGMGVMDHGVYTISYLFCMTTVVIEIGAARMMRSRQPW